MAESDRPRRAGAAREEENIDPDLQVTQTTAEMVDTAARDFQEISLGSFKAGRPLPADLFLPRLLREENRIAMARVASGQQTLRRRMIDQITAAGFSTVYVHSSQMEKVLPCLNAYTRRILERPSVPMQTKAKAIFDNARQIVAQAMSTPELSANLEAGREYVDDVVGFVQKNPACVKNLHEVLASDYNLFTHAVNVCLLLIAFASRLKMKPEKITTLGLGGLFHDIGKRNIPEEILNKPGPLNDEEWEVMRRHPADGVELLRGAGNLPPEAFQMVYQHHENLDGTGYPRGLSQEKVSAFGQLIRIIDAYDALTSTRCYKEAAPAGSAITIMVRDMQTQINQEFLSSFILFLGSLAKA